MLNKKDIADRLADKLTNEYDINTTKGTAKAVIDATIDVVAEALKNGEGISLFGLGKFEIKEKAARNGVNPKTGEKIVIEAHKSVKFTPASDLKNAVRDN